MKWTFKTYYFIAFLLLFLVEFLIAKYLRTGFIRHTFGDFLVVIMLYCFVISFLEIQPWIAGLTVLVFSFIIEFLQVLNLLKFLNLEDNRIAHLVLGSTFHTSDLVAYTLGIIAILLIEYKLVAS